MDIGQADMGKNKGTDRATGEPIGWQGRPGKVTGEATGRQGRR